MYDPIATAPGSDTTIGRESRCMGRACFVTNLVRRSRCIGIDSRRGVNSDVRAHRSVRTASGSDPIKAQLECMIPSLPLRVLTQPLDASPDVWGERVL